MSSFHVHAPGKMVVGGEYAVLEGIPAVVIAVDRYVKLQVQPTSRADNTARTESTLPPEAEATRELAQQHWGELPAAFKLDVRALRGDSAKFGLGSSGAAAAAVSVAVAHYHGHDSGLMGVKEDCFKWALAGHHRIAPQGSGIDVLASCMGGVLKVRRSQDAALQWEPLSWPADLELRVVWTGHEARTSDMVARVKAWSHTQPSDYARCLAACEQAVTRMIDGFQTQSASVIIDAARSYGEAMQALGVSADVPIVEENLSRIASFAKDAGGAAKPSGAGGGDVAIALFHDVEQADRFDRQCTQHGFIRVPLGISSLGAHVPASSSALFS